MIIISVSAYCITKRVKDYVLHQTELRFDWLIFSQCRPIREQAGHTELRASGIKFLLLV